MITLTVGQAPVWIAYELRARLTHLTLTGINEDGELEWIGTKEQWDRVHKEEMEALW